MGVTASRIFPPKPAFTADQLPDLAGKVYLITGPTSGIGLQLAGVLYSRHATVFLAARSPAKTTSTVKALQKLHPESRGRLLPLALDLCSYDSIRAAAQLVRSQEARLDVVFHNAGVLAPPQGSRNAHGVALELGVHCVGPYLLTRLLEGRLRETAGRDDVAPGDVRVVWTGSLGIAMAPKGGIDMEQLRSGAFEALSPLERYNISKASEYFLCSKLAEDVAKDGIISIFIDPGNVKSHLQDNFATEVSWIGAHILEQFLYDPIMGACTNLFAGLSPAVSVDITKERGSWVIPFGRLAPMRKDLVDAAKREVEGAEDGFVAWCHERVSGYLEE